MAQLMEMKAGLPSTVVPVFIPGRYKPTSISVDPSVPSPSSPPKPLLIFTPSQQGTYPVMLFFHGFYLRNHFYTDLLRHISSHGFIVVAPQLCNIIPPSVMEEIEYAAKVADWLPMGLPFVLPANIEANISKLALVGHSRGGKTAFALALGHAKTTQTFSALVGIDPVAGTGTFGETTPKILTYVSDSFNLSIPVTVIGTGLGSDSKGIVSCPCAQGRTQGWAEKLIPGSVSAFAPTNFNHEKFFNECRAPRAHFKARWYGHMDMLDDDPSGLIGKFADSMCVNGKGPRDPMRRCVGGIVVAFLKYNFEGDKVDFKTIVNEPCVAPVELDQVQFDTN